MRILFAGTPRIAVPSLKLVYEQFEICGVLTAPDKRSGRGNALIYSPVKTEALNLHLHILQPDSITDNLIDQIMALSPDILVVAAYGKIFPEKFLKIFPLGGINLHPSLLPEFRGPSPIPATLLAGKTEGGVTIQKLAVQMDAGDILMQEKVKLSGRETTETLTDDFSFIGARMLVSVLESIKKSKIFALPQDHNQATYCKLIKKEQGLINWKDEAVNIERKIRAFIPWPVAFTFFKGKRLAIYEASMYSTNMNKPDNPCGYVMDVDLDYGFLVNTGKGTIALKTVQLQSKNLMDFRSFLNGHKDIIGCTLGA